METSLVDIRDFETISKGLESNISDFHEAVVLDNLNSIFCQPKGGGGPLLRSGIIKTIVQLLKVATNHNNLNVVEKLITSIKYICNDGEVVDLPRTLNGVNAFISVGACSGRLYQYQSCVSNSADLLMLSATFTVLVDLLMIQSPPDLDNENLKMEVFGIIMQWLKISSRSRHFLRESSVCEDRCKSNAECQRALFAVISSLVNSDSGCRHRFAETVGFIAAISSLLRGISTEDRPLSSTQVVATCNLLSALSRCDHARRLLISAELPAALVRCTRRCMEPTIQAEASVACCEAMHSLCSHNDEAWRKALGEADAATVLVQLLTVSSGRPATAASIAALVVIDLVDSTKPPHTTAIANAKLLEAAGAIGTLQSLLAVAQQTTVTTAAVGATVAGGDTQREEALAVCVSEALGLIRLRTVTMPDVSSVTAVLTALGAVPPAITNNFDTGCAIGVHVCNGLYALARDNSSNQKALGDAGACRAIAALLKCPQLDAALAAAVLRSVAVLCRHGDRRDSSHEPNVTKLGTFGVCPDIVTVLRSHGPGCPEVAAAGCRSVYCLTVIDSNSNNDDLGTAGACEAVVDMLKIHGLELGNSEVARCASTAIFNLASRTQNKVKLRATGVLAILAIIAANTSLTDYARTEANDAIERLE